MLKTGGAVGSLAAGLAAASSEASAEHAGRGAPDHVTLSYDETLIKEYQPQLVTSGVEPEPLRYYALHAESTESTLNAVYGFTMYPYQDGNLARQDSHLGDHEPSVVWYDQASGDVVRVDYSAYHWFRGTAPADSFQYADADTDQHRPMLRVDPAYHHHYLYSGSAAGERLEVGSLLDVIESWLNNGLESQLALSQPYDPWELFGRESWWRHTTSNWINAQLEALWFNLGLSEAAKTSDLQEVSTW